MTCQIHPGQPAAHCPLCVREAVPPPPSITAARAALRRVYGARRADYDEARRREAAVNAHQTEDHEA